MKFKSNSIFFSFSNSKSEPEGKTHSTQLDLQYLFEQLERNRYFNIKKKNYLKLKTSFCLFYFSNF